MKLQYKHLALIFIAVFAAACTGQDIQEPETNFAETFPGQFLIGDTYILNNHEKIDGDIFGVGTTLVIDEGAMVIGNVTLIGSNLEVSGRIAGELTLFAGESAIKKNAIVTGSIIQFLHQIQIDPEANVFGEINTYEVPEESQISDPGNLTKITDWLQPKSILAYHILRWVSYILISLLVGSLFSKQTARCVSFLRTSPVASWGAGMIAMIAIPIIALVLILTICLSPIGIILILGFSLSLLWGWIGIAAAVGQQLAAWLHLEWEEYATTVFGAAIVGLLSAFISLIPCLGLIINSLISSFGFGAILLNRFGEAKDQ